MPDVVKMDVKRCVGKKGKCATVVVGDVDRCRECGCKVFKTVDRATYAAKICNVRTCGATLSLDSKICWKCGGKKFRFLIQTEAASIPYRSRSITPSPVGVMGMGPT